MHVIDLLFGLGWVAFWAYWIAMAAKTYRPGLPRSKKGMSVRLGLLVLAILAVHNLPRPWLHSHSNTSMQIIGLVLFALGLALAIWARVYLGNSWGFPADKRSGSELITTGPYRWIRHPIYSGILLAMIGTGIGLAYFWLVIFAVFAVYFIPSAVSEEKYMAAQFPKTYPAYKRHSKMLVPFIF